MREPAAWHIGDLAAQVGVDPRTIRFYERVGLLPKPRRSPSGYRIYGASDGERLGFVLKAKAVGLSLEDIRRILAVRDGGDAPCSHVRSLIREKLDEVEAKIAALRQMEAELQALHEEAERSELPEGCFCGIIEQHAEHRPSDLR